jgi:orotate phosphoribosyltransferase
LTSGRHSDTYVEKFRLLENPAHTETLCRLIAEYFRSQGVKLVAGPTTGGIIISYEVARQLGVRGVFAERSDGGRSFERGFIIEPGERILVVDDILTTGGSIRDVLEAVRAAGGEPIGVGVLLDRTGGQIDFGVPLFSCHSLVVPSYEPEACPQCAAGVPLTKT